MTFEEFQALPRRFGWRYEWVDGRARIRPSDTVVVTSLELAPFLDRPEAPGLRAPRESDHARLADSFTASFVGTAEYFERPEQEVRESARWCLGRWFEGRQGERSDASRMVVDGCGAALVVLTRRGPVLDLLFVRPERRREGLATRLVSAACSVLAGQGHTRFTSVYHAANEESAAWHHRFGFGDEPDLLNARRLLAVLEAEVHRLERAGEDASRARAEREAQARLVEALQRVADREGLEQVSPLLSIRPLA